MQEQELAALDQIAAAVFSGKGDGLLVFRRTATHASVSAHHADYRRREEHYSFGRTLSFINSNLPAPQHGADFTSGAHTGAITDHGGESRKDRVSAGGAITDHGDESRKDRVSVGASGLSAADEAQAARAGMFV